MHTVDGIARPVQGVRNKVLGVARHSASPSTAERGLERTRGLFLSQIKRSRNTHREDDVDPTVVGAILHVHHISPLDVDTIDKIIST
jgi:hypothetical protein